MRKTSVKDTSGFKEKERFRQQLREIFEEAEMTLTDFARLLEAEARTSVSPTRLSVWIKGRGSPLNGDLRHALLAGARRVQKLLALEGHQQQRAVEAARWGSGTEAREQIEKWLEQGLNLRQIAIAGQISETQLALWHSGAATRIDRYRFERCKLLVNHWLDVLADSGALDCAPAADVGRLMQEWRAAGLSDDDVQAVAEIPPSLFSKWLLEQPLPTAHLKRVQVMMSHWLKLKEHREAGGGLPQVQKRQRLARPQIC